MEAEMCFTRKGGAKVLGIRASKLQDWSRGKPLNIMPSLPAPYRKGAKTVYSLLDLYVCGIALCLCDGGMGFKKISQVLPRIDPSWFSVEVRGVLRFARLETDDPLVAHGTADGRGAIRFYLAHGRTQCHHLNLKVVLDWIDSRVGELKPGPLSS